MAYPARYYHLINEMRASNEYDSDVCEENCCSKRSFDDLQIIQMKKNYARDMNLCENPRLGYLNLLDYEDKIGNFQSSGIGCISMYRRPTEFKSSLRSYDEFTWGSIFYFFVEYLKNMPKDCLDRRALDRRICHVVKKLGFCSRGFRRVIFSAIIDLYNDSPTEEVVFAMVLKHMCSFEDILTYIARQIFTSLNAVFVKEFLDECVNSRSNFLTMWKRNFILNDISHCPMTYAYLQGKLDLLTVLLDYGFHQTYHRASTLEILLIKQSKLYRIPWLQHFVYPTDLKSRGSTALEVFLFMTAFLEPSKNSDVLVKCFKLVWDSRKKPYVSKQELENAFENYIKVEEEETYRWCKLEQLRLWFYRRLSDFRTLLPDCQTLVPQPRSLQHLCRCTIRETLNDNLELPHGVAKLSIPNTLKSYILLK